MNLVQDHELSLVVVEIKLGLGQLGPVPLGLEIQVHPAIVLVTSTARVVLPPGEDRAG